MAPNPHARPRPLPRHWLRYLEIDAPLYTVDRDHVAPYHHPWESVPTLAELLEIAHDSEPHYLAVAPTSCGECGGPLTERLQCGCSQLAFCSNLQLHREYVRRIGGQVRNTGYPNTPLAW